MKRTSYYRQHLIELGMACKNHMDPITYSEFAEHHLMAFTSLLSELDDMPKEIDTDNQRDMYKMRAYIKMLESKCNYYKQLYEGAIEEFEEMTVCPLDEREYPADLCPDRECKQCWTRYLSRKSHCDEEDYY